MRDVRIIDGRVVTMPTVPSLSAIDGLIRQLAQPGFRLRICVNGSGQVDASWECAGVAGWETLAEVTGCPSILDALQELPKQCARHDEACT